MKINATGAIASSIDYRDLIARAAVVPPPMPIANLPATFSTDLGTVLDQNKIPACVAHDVVYLIRRYWFSKKGKWTNLSPRFLDILAKKYDGLDVATDGTYPRLVLKLAMQYGCATEAVLPNDTTLPVFEYRNDELITDDVMNDAAQYKIPGFINVGTDPVSTRNGIYLYGALSTLFQIGEEMYTPSWASKDIDPLRTPKSIISGHQMSPFGWGEGALLRGRNEWSNAWNTGGNFSYDPVTWQKYIIEQWAIADVPADLKAFLSQLPSPTNFHYQWTANLKRGDVGKDVGMVQVALMILGHLKPITAVEFGYYGPKTAQAVFAFQASNKIMPTSPDNVGPMTRTALNKKFV